MQPTENTETVDNERPTLCIANKAVNKKEIS